MKNKPICIAHSQLTHAYTHQMHFLSISISTVRLLSSECIYPLFRALRPLTFSLRRSESVCGSVDSLTNRLVMDKFIIDRAFMCDKPILYCSATSNVRSHSLNLLGKNALNYFLGILPTTPRRSIRIQFTLGKKSKRSRFIYARADRRGLV